MPLAISLMALIMGISIALAFVKINGITLPTVIQHYLRFSMSPRIYLWKNFELPNQLLTTTQEKIVIQKHQRALKLKQLTHFCIVASKG